MSLSVFGTAHCAINIGSVARSKVLEADCVGIHHSPTLLLSDRTYQCISVLQPANRHLTRSTELARLRSHGPLTMGRHGSYAMTTRSSLSLVWGSAIFARGTRASARNSQNRIPRAQREMFEVDAHERAVVFGCFGRVWRPSCACISQKILPL